MNEATDYLAGGLTCAAITDDGRPCGGDLYEGDTFSPVRIPLCEKHAANLYNHSVGSYRTKLVEQMEEEGVLTHTSGWTYIVQLPNARYKIGTSKTSSGVASRWRAITRQYEAKGYQEPLKPVALIPGGTTMEALLHGKFKEYRVTDELGEQFIADPALVAYAEEQGIPEDMRWLVANYESYWKKKHTQPPVVNLF